MEIDINTHRNKKIQSNFDRDRIQQNNEDFDQFTDL